MVQLRPVGAKYSYGKNYTVVLAAPLFQPYVAHRAFVPSLSGHEFIGQRIVVVVVVVGFCSGTEDVIKSNPGTSKLTVQILGTLKVA